MTQWITRCVVGVPLALGACGAEPVQRGASDDPFAAKVTGVRDAHMSGQVGPRVIDADADQLHLFTSDTDLVVVSAAEFETYAVMLQVTVTTDEPLLVPHVAEHTTFSEGRQRLRLLGCTGQGLDVYDEYESLANGLTFIVDDAEDGAPGDVEVTATGTWDRPHADPPSDPRVAVLRFVLER